MSPPLNPLRTGPLHPAMLFWYLDRFCNKRDAVSFYDAAGEPDLYAARAYAEELRTRLKLAVPTWDRYFTVTQRNYEVVLTSNLAAPVEADERWYRSAHAKLVAAVNAEQAQAKTKQGSRDYAAPA